MNAHTHRQRLHFLSLKARMGSITPEERKELEWRGSFRVTDICGGSVTIIESHPMTVDEWKAMVERSRGDHGGPLQADAPVTDAGD